MAVQGNAISRIDLLIWWPLKADMPHDADAAFGVPELIDHLLCNRDSVVNDVALLRCEHVVDRQELVGVDAHSVH